MVAQRWVGAGFQAPQVALGVLLAWLPLQSLPLLLLVAGPVPLLQLLHRPLLGLLVHLGMAALKDWAAATLLVAE